MPPLFNALEILTAQHFSPLKGLYSRLLRMYPAAVKNKLVGSHRPSGSDSPVRILLVSDLQHVDLAPTDLANKALTVVIKSKHLPNTVITEATDLDKARWLNTFNDPEVNDPGNLDLDYLYRLLADLQTMPPVSWQIVRTVYDPDVAVREERTLGGTTRDSRVWDSNKECPVLGPFDLVLMRRGLCYCFESGIACCGCQRKDASDTRFLLKVHNLLRDNTVSAAYLAGWNPLTHHPKSRSWWEEACAEAQKQAPKGVFQVVPAAVKPMMMAGVFVSRGRTFPTEAWSVPNGILEKYIKLDNQKTA
jgi:hypothetical protein